METVWYLGAVHNHPPTNQYLMKVIGEGNEECLYSDKVCADGKKRDLFGCPKGYADVQDAISAIPDFGLKIEVFKLEGDNRPVRFDLWKQTVKKKGKAVRRMASMLRPRQKAV